MEKLKLSDVHAEQHIGKLLNVTGYAEGVTGTLVALRRVCGDINAEIIMRSSTMR